MICTNQDVIKTVVLVLRLHGNVEAHVVNDSAVAVASAKSSPEIKAHINRVVVAQVAIGNNTGSRDAVVRNGDLLAAQLVVLSRSILVKEARGHRDKGRVGVHVLEIRADAAGAVLAQDAVALVGISKAVDGAVGVVLVDIVAAARRGVATA